MKKNIFYFLVLLFAFTSCIVKETVESNVPNIINGTWQINKNPYENISFNTNGSWIYTSSSDTISGTYIVEVEQQSTPYFIWNSEDNVHKIIWKTNTGENGETVWIGYSEESHNKILLKNIYRHADTISVLTKKFEP